MGGGRISLALHVEIEICHVELLLGGVRLAGCLRGVHTRGAIRDLGAAATLEGKMAALSQQCSKQRAIFLTLEVIYYKKKQFQR